MSYRTLHRAFLAAAVAVLLVATAGCAGPRPLIKVLGVTPKQAGSGHQHGALLVVYVEVVNPSHRVLKLSRLDYRLRAPSWFDTEGRVPLSRPVGADSSVVVEIPVAISKNGKWPQGAPYVLEGKLFGVEDQIQRSWQVQAKGALTSKPGGMSWQPVRAQIMAGR